MDIKEGPGNFPVEPTEWMMGVQYRGGGRRGGGGEEKATLGETRLPGLVTLGRRTVSQT